MDNKNNKKEALANVYHIRQCFLIVWCHQESNRGHKDFQSSALPTELWHHTPFNFAAAKVVFFL